MRAIFYRFSKRLNSTLIPPEFLEHTVYDIILKDDSGLLQPEIFLKWSGSGNPCRYNYCYIPDFSRYYWVSNWTYTERQWAASLSVDVLASFKDQIGSLEKYVLRAYSEYDPTVLDTFYPATAETTWTPAVKTVSEFGMDTITGCYVLGVSGASTAGTVGGNIYYVCSQAQLINILHTVFSDPGSYGSALSAASTVEDVLRIIGEMEYRGVVDVPSFINSLMWVPFAIDTIAPGTNVDVYLGYLKAGQARRPAATVYYQSNNIEYDALFTGTGPRWPEVEPYSQYELYWPPFGAVPLDGASLISSPSKRLVLDLYFDIISGLGRVVYKYTGLTPAGELSAMLGVPIAVHGQWYDYSAIMSSFANLVGGAAAAVAGNPMGVMGSIGNMISGFSSQAAGSGRSGGRGGIGDGVYITCRRLSHVEEDPYEAGRPLCAIRTISDLSGYVMCRDGDAEIEGATDGELEQISQYLTGGFFYDE